MTAYKNENNRQPVRLAAALTGVWTAFGFATAQADVQFNPRVGADLTWTDNVDLAPPGQPKQDDLIARLTPGVRVLYDNRRMNVYLDYQLQALAFKNDGDKDEVFDQGQFGLQLAAIDNWLYLDASAQRSQTAVDPAQPSNVQNLFQVGNVADSTSAQATPILKHDFRFAQLEASYTRGFVDYVKTSKTTVVNDLSLDDSRNRNTTAALRSADPNDLVTWGATYRRDQVDYDLAETFKYERMVGELGILVSPHLRLLANGGAESDSRQDTSKGGLNSSLWEVGFEWHDGQLSELRLLAGKRFFGTTVDGSWRYTGRIMEADVSYREAPTTQTQNTVLKSFVGPGIFPPGLDTQLSRTTADVYLLKQLAGDIGLRGRLTEIFLGVTSERRYYYTAPTGTDRYDGVNIQASRRLGPELRIEVRAAFDDAHLRDATDFQDRNFSVSLSRLLGRATSLVLSANHYERTGATSGYTANWVMLGFNMTFGPQNARAGNGGMHALPGTTGFPTVPSGQMR